MDDPLVTRANWQCKSFVSFFVFLFFISSRLLHWTNQVIARRMILTIERNKRERKKTKEITVLIRVWFRRKVDMRKIKNKKCHARWVRYAIDVPKIRHERTLLFWQNTSFPNVLVSEPLKGWTGYWQCNYIYRKGEKKKRSRRLEFWQCLTKKKNEWDVDNTVSKNL